MIVQCDKLALGYGGKAVVENVSFALARGEICAVLGHNGAGKSTFIKSLLGLHTPLAGHFDWQGGAAPKRAYLGQRSEFDGQFPMRVRDLVTMGAWHGLGFWSSIDAAKQAAVTRALQQTNLTHIADRPIYECSSGQLQRCFFARAIVQDAPVIVLDEPFTAIDQATEANLVQIMTSWRNEGRALVVVLHDLMAVKSLCDKVLLLGDGRAQFGTPAEVLRPDNLLAYQYLSPTQAGWLSSDERIDEAKARSDA